MTTIEPTDPRIEDKGKEYKRFSLPISDVDLRAAQDGYVEALQKLCPKWEVLVQEVDGETRSSWHSLKECKEKEHKTNIYGRSILPFEILYESDFEDWVKVIDITKRILEFCREKEIPCDSAFSGGKSIHNSIFFDFNKVTISDDLVKDFDEFDIDVIKEGRMFLAKWVLLNAHVDFSDVDWANIKWSTKSKGHLVRSFGCKREDGALKTYLISIPEEKPAPGSLELMYPTERKLWDISGLQNEIIEHLKKVLKETSKPFTYDDTRYKEIKGVNSILDVVPNKDKLTKIGDFRYQGPHPSHGSKTGSNFSVNLKKGIWHCFRCGTGGGILELIAVVEGIMPCEESVKGALRGDLFKKVLRVAKDKYGVELGDPIGYDINLNFKGGNFGVMYFKSLFKGCVISIAKGDNVLLSETKFSKDFLQVPKTRDRVFGYVKTEVGDAPYEEFISYVSGEIERIAERQKERGEEEKKAEERKEDADIEKEAMEIIENGDYIEFIVKTVQKMHAGDTRLIRYLVYVAFSKELPYRIHNLVVGTTGVGKTDVVRKFFKVLPDDEKIRIDFSSPKSFFYAVRAGVDLNSQYIFLDDIEQEAGILSIIKTMGSDDPDDVTHWTVDEKKFIEIKVPRNSLIFGTTIEALSDKQGQLLRRYQIINPDESKEARAAAMELIGEEGALPSCVTENIYRHDIDICKKIFKLIKARKLDVFIPFEISYPSVTTSQKTEYKAFLSFVKSVTIANHRKRGHIQNNPEILIAEEEDFNTAIELWKETIPYKVDQTAKGILEALDEREPAYKDAEEAAKYHDEYIEPITATLIAKRFKIPPRTAREKLANLYDVGLADRKQWKGRGSPFCYWKSPTVTLEDELKLRKISMCEIAKKDTDDKLFDRLQKLSLYARQKFDPSYAFLSLSSIYAGKNAQKRSEDLKGPELKTEEKIEAESQSAIITEKIVESEFLGEAGKTLTAEEDKDLKQNNDREVSNLLGNKKIERKGSERGTSEKASFSENNEKPIIELDLNNQAEITGLKLKGQRMSNESFTFFRSILRDSGLKYNPETKLHEGKIVTSLVFIDKLRTLGGVEIVIRNV